MTTLQRQFNRAKTAGPEAANVFVINNDGVLCSSVELILREIEVPVTSCRSAEEFLDKFDPAEPACLLFDICLPGIDKLALHDLLRKTVDWLPIIYVAESLDWPTAVAMMRAGAWDVLKKPLDRTRLIATVTDALQKVAEFRRFSTIRSQTGSRLATLSKRETEVLHWILDGLCSREIADLLGTSPNTVEKQRANLLHKLGAKSLAELASVYYVVDPEHLMPRIPGSEWWNYHPHTL